jgi:hypothetical protein
MFARPEEGPLPWTEAETPDGWRLEVFEDARGRFYPRRWIFAAAEKIAFPIEVSDGLRNYGFATAEAAIEYAYRERRQRELLADLSESRSAARPKSET